MHGSRSGIGGNSAATEFAATAQYAEHEPNGLAWGATIGEDIIAIHMPIGTWGWHARGCSPDYVGCEFAQPTVNDPITDGMVRAFCWFVQTKLRGKWPDFPLHFPTHSEVDGTAEYGGKLDGKTDAFPLGDPRTEELRARIAARLSELGV